MRRRVFVLALLAVGAAALRLQIHPLRIPAIERAESADRPSMVDLPQAILLVDDAAVLRAAESARPERFDASYAWVDPLQEEFGATACMDLRDLAREGFAASAQVVVRSPSLRNDQRLAQKLLALAETGRLVVFDALGSRDAELLGLTLEGPIDADRHDPIALHPAVRVQELYSLRGLSGMYRPLLRVDDEVVVALLPVGRGAILLCGFDVANSMHRARDDAYARAVQPLPQLDLMLRGLLQPAQALLLMPRISPIPAGSEGVFLSTLSDDGMGAASDGLVANAHSAGNAVTVFVDASAFPSAALASPGLDHVEVGLQWNRKTLRTRWALGRLEPFRQLPSLDTQIAALRGRDGFDEKRPLWNRTRGGLRAAELPRAFRILEANGVCVDASLGPSAGQTGWPSGSGRPYHPLDSNGRPFALLEIPYPYSSDDPDFGAMQSRLFDGSRRLARAVIAPKLRSGSMRRAPSAARMLALLAQPQQASSHGHSIMSLGEYLRFRESRLASRVLRSRGQWELRIAGAGLAVEIPVGELPIELRIDGLDVPLPDAHPSGWVTIPIDEGTHQLQVLERP